MSVIFKKDTVAYVGQEHGKSPNLSKSDMERVKAIADKYGAWYEGDGKDKVAGVKYEGSWDEELAKDIKGYPEEFLFVLFTNTAVNNQKDILVGDDTIFERILATQDKLNYFKDKQYDAKTLTKFLSDISSELLAMSKKPATKSNVAAFVSEGEKLMWGGRRTPARAFADKANAVRDKWLRDQKSGVYYMGKDHLKELKGAAEAPLQGGSKII